MAAEPEVFEILCDAPPFAVVTGCRLIGLARPEDVRWCRAGAAATGPVRRLVHFFAGTTEAAPCPAHQKDVVCQCGQPQITLHKYQFTFNTGQQRYYRLGQCCRCQTIHWDDA